MDNEHTKQIFLCFSSINKMRREGAEKVKIDKSWEHLFFAGVVKIYIKLFIL